MPQVYNHRLTKYIHIQNDLGPKQKTKRAICKACESKENLFQRGQNEGLALWQVYEKCGFINRWDHVQWHWKKCSYWCEFWIEKDQEIMMYPDPDEKTARNAVVALKQARAQNNTSSMSIISSDTYFVVHQLSSAEQNEFYHRLLRMIVENGISFQFTKTQTFHEFVTFSNTTVKISNRRTLSNKILKEYAEKSENAQISTLLEMQEPVTIMFDRWKNVCRQEILGAVILSATNRLYVWGAEDISDTSQKIIDILNTIRTFLECAKKQNLNVVAM
ncbi:8050_t:CDS:2, partial [Cetraspora pellucida]